jgi:hypothetical protein
MTQTGNERRGARLLPAGVGSAGFLLLLVALLLPAAPAVASYQQVDNFAGVPGLLEKESELNAFPEEAQMGGLGGMAVNYTGTGGVPAGTVYAVGQVPQPSAEGVRIARYNPDGSFSEAWEVRVGPYERCGPDGEAAKPSCPPRPLGSPPGVVDVDVDQTTGNVYVLNYIGNVLPGDQLITEYSADGSEVIARFGEKAASSDTIAASPAKIHETLDVGGLAVNAAGEVYVFDYKVSDNFYHRLMVFKPKTPGDYTAYEYAGQSRDVAAGFASETRFPIRPVADAAGNVYAFGEAYVEKYDPTHPTDPPLCSFEFKKGGITAGTVHPTTGEVFFYTYQDRRVHRLNPCKGGSFSEAETIKISPSRQELTGMAVDPVRQFEPSRAAGILYTGSSNGEGGEVEGSYPNNKVESAMGYVFAPPVELPPQIVSESVSGVTQSSARLEGQVDPKGNVTRYVFQYLTEAAYQANEEGDRFAGATEAPLGGARIEGSEVIPVATAIGGLAAGAEYRYRILATSNCAPSEPEKVCVGAGEAKSFRTYPALPAGLPDGRAWEMVSPPQKDGGQVYPVEPWVASHCSTVVDCKPGFTRVRFPMQPSPDGNSVVYEADSFSVDEGAVLENEYIARRTGSGWQSVNLTPALLQSGEGRGYTAFKADLSEGVLEQNQLTLSPLAPAGFFNLYTQPSADPTSLTPLLGEAPPNREGSGPERFELDFAGASADFSRLFFEANDALTPDAEGGPEGETNLYERSGGQLHLVNVAPGNATTIPGAVFGSGNLLEPNRSDRAAFHAISEDGSRAFWTVEEDGGLYVREGGETQQIPDPNSCATSLPSAQRVCFLAAAADGSRVLLSDGLLFDVEDLAAPPLDLTQGEGGFEGVVGQSEDLSRIYFVDTAVLSGKEENEFGAKAEAGKFNLYAWQEGETTFVAGLSGSASGVGFDPDADWHFAPIHRSAAASPNGSWLAFTATTPLTGFDNVGACTIVSNSEEFTPGPCPEVFLYEAETGRLRCPSCNRTGAPPRGSSRLRQVAANTFAPSLPQPHYLTNSGRLLFDSRDSLSPFDTNGSYEDVYEFEPNGVGGCASESDCVSLISAGRGGTDSNFVTMDPSGKNVFFTTRDQLVDADVDELVDLYVAREGGGFAPNAAAGECQGEACLPSVSPPYDQTPSSASFRGPGNAKPTKGRKRCPKGRRKVRRKGNVRCVKRQAKRDRRTHRQRRHDRGGAK